MAKILFIEDNDQLLKLYQGILEDEGFKVVVAKTASAGLDLVINEKPNVIILDIMLPGDMNGFDFLERIKKDTNLNKIPVIVLTNLDSEEKVAREIGAADYVIKVRVDPKEVVNKIKKILQI